MYPGTIGSIERGEALILFDDEDRGNVPLGLLRPLALAVGDPVQARRSRAVKWYEPAQVVGIDGENLEVRYADGALDSLAVGYVRVPANGVNRTQAMTTAGASTPEHLATALDRLVNGLVAKEFFFLTPETSAQQLQERLARFDEGRLGIFSKVFSFALGATDMPGFVKTIAGRVVSLGASSVNDEDLANLHRVMSSSFPLSAIAFSRLYGPRFVAIVDGDGITQPELVEAMNLFEQINLCMMDLGGRLELKLFGKSIAGLNCSAATGSLIVVAGDSERAGLLRQWVNSKPLRSDTAWNQMKERFTSFWFWAKAAVGIIEYKPHQLRQEAIVLDAQTGKATSTASARLGFEFGFSLSDIAAT
jgi:hypothetical protein